MARKYSSTSVETTLASGINATQTTMTVPNSNAATALLGGQTLGNAVGGVYPDIFTVVIDPDTASEEVVFVQNVNGSTLVISRAQAGTGQTPGSTGIEHAAGATVRHVLTSSDLDFFRNGVATADAAIAKTIIDAKGDLIVGSAADTPVRFPVGSTNGQVLSVDSSAANGLAWSTISSAPKIGQVVSVNFTTNLTTNSTSYVDVTGLSASITPTSATSKILILCSYNAYVGGNFGANSGGALSFGYFAIARGSTRIVESQALGWFSSSLSTNDFTLIPQQNIVFLDSPSTTASTTYKLQVRSNGTGTSPVTSGSSGVSSITLLEVLV